MNTSKSKEVKQKNSDRNLVSDKNLDYLGLGIYETVYETAVLLMVDFFTFERYNINCQVCDCSTNRDLKPTKA